MSQSDSLLVKLRKYCFVINQSDSLLVKLRKHYLLTLFAGTLGGFTYAALSSHSLQIVMIGAIIGGLSYSSAECVSLLGNTWWQRGLFWGTTMAITIGGLIHLLLPSVHYSFLPRLIGFLAAGLPYYLARGQKGLIRK
ncbi:MAG: hypothetical protein RMY64_34460 [Nostoc sp. DedQUE08]|uniref:hypothetical protein n=1 Tax=Nostoc sp. DedQUE08 TaxID=3075393 RepID=UPI002AD4D828|nr:hypothetical protein [Nostoc sp. DedQUE08]MDZ8070657.1 hypothetical protein [Nostoc sp. DedQUE08]